MTTKPVALNLNLSYEGREVRTVGTSERPEWIAADACAVLGLENTSRALATIPARHKGVTIRNTPGGPQEMATVTEAGLYRLIFKSRKTEAEAFQEWVFNEVLPAIRKHGTYPAPTATREPGLGAEQLRDLVTTIVAESLTPFLAQLRAATAAPPPMPIYPRATIRERLLWKNWPEASGSDRKKVHKLACALIDANLLETPVQAGGPGGGGPLYFFGAQLAFLDEAIDRVREAKQRRERAAGPHLFTGAA